MSKLKLIQVGVGGWGESWASISRQSEDFEVVAYVDVSRSNLQSTAAKNQFPNSKCYTELERALREIEADAVLGVVPANFHSKVAIEALHAGKHVLIEKPLADTMENAKEMIRTAEKTGLILMVSQNYRYRRPPRTVRKVLQEDFIGQLGYATVNFHKAPPFTGIYYLKLPEPIITEMVIHHFDLMRYLLGKDPVSIFAKSWRPKWSWFDGNPTVEISVEMQDDIRVNYFGSWVSRGWETTWNGDWHIEGSEGEICWNENGIRVTLQEPTRTFKSVYSRNMTERSTTLDPELMPMPLEDRWYSLHEFARSIIEHKEPETSAKDNIRSLAMMFGALESIKSGERVPIGTNP